MPDDRVPVPSVVEPSLKVTVPVAVDGVTVAFSVAPCASTAGLTLLVSTVVVGFFVTVSLTALDVLAALLEFPPYTAVRLCVPVVLNVAEYVAMPEARVPVPSVVVPSLNVTVPVAVDGVTVAFSVVLCANAAGLTLLMSTVVVGFVATVSLTALEVLVA
jgi:hypothetical protein